MIRGVQVDLEAMFTKVRNDFVTKKTNIESYINDSTTTKDIATADNLAAENVSTNEQTEAVNTQSAVEEVVNYTVTSKEVVEELNKKIEALDNKINETFGQATLDKIRGINKEEISEEIINKSEVANFVTKELTVTDKESILDYVYNLYKEFLTSQNSFYLNNTNTLLKDTTSKVNSLAEYTNYSTIADIRYIYLELPNLLENEMKIYSLNNCVEINKLTANITEKLTKLVQINKVVTQEYNNKITEDIKNSRENN